MQSQSSCSSTMRVLLVAWCFSWPRVGLAFQIVSPSHGGRSQSNPYHLTMPRSGTTTIDPPTRERTDRRTTTTDPSRKNYDDDDYNNTYDDDDDDDYNNDDDDQYGDLEYLMDSQASREMDDPFHILLLGSTFEKPKITIPYVASTLEYVVSMPRSDAVELSQFAKDQGLSCLGSWPREECLTLGKQLQVRDLECRVVPYCDGGQRGWQAKDVSSSSASSSSSSSSSN